MIVVHHLNSSRSRCIALLTVLATSVAGCATSPSDTRPDSLRGTAWRLLAIQSMDDAQGTTRIADPSRYTLRFDADDRAAIRLDCNHGTGTWAAEAARDGTGSLQFGPIAMTRMFCPPPSLGDRVGRDLGFARSYRLKDGRLYLSLMADGGILEWEPETLTRP